MVLALLTKNENMLKLSEIIDNLFIILMFIKFKRDKGKNNIPKGNVVLIIMVEKNKQNFIKEINSFVNKHFIDFNDSHLEKNKIFNMNCIDLINIMINKNFKVDAIITDPPYNISRKNNFKTIRRYGIDFGNWDKNFNQVDWIKNTDKILNENGSIIIFNDWRNLGLIANSLENNNFIVKDIIRWIKPNPMPRNVDRRYVTDFEFAIWATKKKSKWVFNKDKSIKYLKPEYIGASPNSKNRFHPTQKSKEVIEEIIKTHTNIGDLIFDPFSGSGEISVCAYNLNRSFIGSEINKKYFDVSNKRISNFFVRPAFNHLGNKHRIIKELIQKFPNKNIENFVDVFAGSGIVSSLYRTPKKIFMNEKDKHLYEILEFLCNSKSINVLSEIKKIIKKYNLPVNEKKDYKIEFNKLKKDFNSKNKNNKIVMLFVLILYGFNQQLRFNSNNEFNIPVGKFFWTKYHELKIKEFIDLNSTKNISISNLDFEEFINNVSQNTDKDNTLYYFDPPYLITNATYNLNWTENEEKKLIKILDFFIENKYKWFLSNQLISKGNINSILFDFIKRNIKNIEVFKINTNYSNSNYQRKPKNNNDLEILIRGVW